MKATFETTDEQEMMRLAKSGDMAAFIFELTHNGWRKFKDTDYDYERAWDVINELLDTFGINIDELIS